MNNPFIQQPQNPQFNFGYNMGLQRYDFNIVHGEEGAKAFRMAPNSRTVLVDETAPLIWFAHTDAAGYLTIEPYDIIPHQNQPQVDINELAERIKKLEDIYVQQSITKPKKQRTVAATNEPADVAT